MRKKRKGGSGGRGLLEALTSGHHRMLEMAFVSPCPSQPPVKVYFVLSACWLV